MTVRFILSNNLPSSITRLTADAANIFARQGIRMVIHFPAVDWWDYKQFVLSRLPRWRRPLVRLRLFMELFTGLLFRRKWCGFRVHRIDPRVRAVRYLRSPSASDWRQGDVAVVHPPYLLPHLLQTLPHAGVKLTTMLHVNLEKAISSPSTDTSAWYAHWVAFHRLLSVPTVATSEEAKRAAQRLGIRVDKLIPGGIDLTLFRPSNHRRKDESPVITLYCDPNPQKGRDLGIEALRSVKRRFPEIRLCSLGRVTPSQARGFDQNHGYLHGEEYARTLRECDIFVYPSLYDGFPAPPLQAMASGAAVVTTAVEGVTDYAQDGQDCLLCHPGDSDGMRAQIDRLIQDGALRERLRSHGPITAERFRIEHSAAQLLDFLREMGLER